MPRLSALLLAALTGLLASGAARAEGPLLAPVLPIPADEASRQVAVVVRPGLARTLDLPTEGLRQARRDMLADVPVADADLRALADHGDGLAAQRLVRRLLLDPATPASDVAWYASLAVATGRVWTLPEAVEAMRRLDPATEPPERVRLYAEVLQAHAWAGNALALDALVDLNGEGRLFGPLSEATRARIMEAGEAAGDGRVPLRLALALLQAPSDGDRALARGYLEAAAAGTSPAVRAVAATLLARLDAAPAEGES